MHILPDSFMHKFHLGDLTQIPSQVPHVIQEEDF